MRVSTIAFWPYHQMRRGSLVPSVLLRSLVLRPSLQGVLFDPNALTTVEPSTGIHLMALPPAVQGGSFHIQNGVDLG